ncbi:MAG TPA: CinA family protein [Candidatus Sulfotelmatobacter sp.]|nr:CinA family protein [Candidatus Sulfotelmatobacter sp.]
MIPRLEDAARAVLAACEGSGDLLATAESCTGGMVAMALTAIAGSSRFVDRGFVTYSNQAKAEMLDVPMALIESHGAVSAEVALAMVEGALARSQATLAVSVTGIAGPGGGSESKPVGTVYLAVGRKGGRAVAELQRFDGDRDAVRLQSALRALALLTAAIPSS